MPGHCAWWQTYNRSVASMKLTLLWAALCVGKVLKHPSEPIGTRESSMQGAVSVICFTMQTGAIYLNNLDWSQPPIGLTCRLCNFLHLNVGVQSFVCLAHCLRRGFIEMQSMLSVLYWKCSIFEFYPPPPPFSKFQADICFVWWLKVTTKLSYKSCRVVADVTGQVLLRGQGPV